MSAPAAPQPIAAVPSEPPALRSPIRIPMRAVLLVCVALVAVEAVTAVLTMTDLRLALLGVCVTLVVVFGLVFCLGAITIAGFAAGAGAAGVVVLEPGYLGAALLAMAVISLVCGVAPGWARVEAWQAARSSPVIATEEAAGPTPVEVRRRTLPARLQVLWRTDRVVAAFLVLSFPPVFVTAALAFVRWTYSHT